MDNSRIVKLITARKRMRLGRTGRTAYVREVERPKTLSSSKAQGWRYVFVDTAAIDDPACVRSEDDPSSAFAQYLIPRIKKGTDDASREVREAMKSGRLLTDAVADAVEAMPASKTKRLRVWAEEALSSRVYAYVVIRVWLPRDGDRYINGSLDYGFMTTSGGPHEDQRDHTLLREGLSSTGFDKLQVVGGWKAEDWDRYHELIDAAALLVAEHTLGNWYPPKDVERACTILRRRAL